MIKALALAVVLSTVSMTAQAANFNLVGKTLNYSGTVEVGDPEEMKRFLDNYDIDRVVLDSNGGVANVGYNLGFVLAEFEGVVAVEIKCLSACGTAFLGAKNKEITGVVGLHVAWVEGDLPTNSALKSGQVMGFLGLHYLLKMGYTPQLGWLATAYTEKDTFLVFTNTPELEQFKGAYEDSIELPSRWVAEHIAGPTRLQMLIEGF